MAIELYDFKDDQDSPGHRCQASEKDENLGLLKCVRRDGHRHGSITNAKGTSFGFNHVAIRVGRHNHLRYFTW